MVMLLKPQFEATRQEIARCRGIIKDTTIQRRVLAEIKAFCEKKLIGSVILGEMESPIKGATAISNICSE